MPDLLPYHIQVRDYFKKQTKTWEFFAAPAIKASQLKELKLDLLKSHYEFRPDTDAALFEKVNKAKQMLGLPDLHVFVYQMQKGYDDNASIIFIEGEAHIIFSGNLVESLSGDELQAVIAHELSHVLFFQTMGGDLEVTNRIMQALDNHAQSGPAHLATARLFQLYTEIYCDRGAFTVAGEIEPMITALVKITTGLKQVFAANYIRQADEIFALQDASGSDGITHPESFIRTRALQLWKEQGQKAEAEIVRMVEGRMPLNQLDLFQQKTIQDLTRTIIQLFLKPRWFQSLPVLSLARQYQPDLKMDPNILLGESLIERIKDLHTSVKEYLAYLLLDHLLVDPSLELVPFGWGYQFAEDLGIRDQFDARVKKEFRFTEKRAKEHRQQAASAYLQVTESAAEQIYED